MNAHPVFRKHFQFFANYKPFKSYPGIPSVHKDVDMLFLRETTEGFKVDGNMSAGYGEFQPTEDMAIGICITTRYKSRLIAEAAFEGSLGQVRGGRCRRCTRTRSTAWATACSPRNAARSRRAIPILRSRK